MIFHKEKKQASEMCLRKQLLPLGLVFDESTNLDVIKAKKAGCLLLLQIKFKTTKIVLAL